MKKTEIYCDYCKQRITEENKTELKHILTPWKVIILNLSNYTFAIEGDACKNCYISYMQWTKTRLQQTQEEPK